METMMGLYRASTFKIEDRKAIVIRALQALLDSPDCRYKTESWRKLTPEEQSNWDARETMVAIQKTFPVSGPES